MGVMGSSTRRIDGEAKVTGAAIYCLDYEEPRMLHAKLLRSHVPSGRIVRLDTSAAAALPGVRVVATAADAGGPSGLFIKDQPLFAGEAVRYAGEPIAAVAAESLEAARAALAAIEVEIEPTDPVADPEDALAPDARLVHPRVGRLCVRARGRARRQRRLDAGSATAATSTANSPATTWWSSRTHSRPAASTRATSSRAARSRDSKPGASSSTPRRSSPISCATASPRRWSSGRRRCG